MSVTQKEVRDHNKSVVSSDATNRMMVGYEQTVSNLKHSVLFSRIVAVAALIVLGATWH